MSIIAIWVDKALTADQDQWQEQYSDSARLWIRIQLLILANAVWRSQAVFLSIWRSDLFLTMEQGYTKIFLTVFKKSSCFRKNPDPHSLSV